MNPQIQTNNSSDLRARTGGCDLAPGPLKDLLVTR